MQKQRSEEVEEEYHICTIFFDRPDPQGEILFDIEDGLGYRVEDKEFRKEIREKYMPEVYAIFSRNHSINSLEIELNLDVEGIFYDLKE